MSIMEYNGSALVAMTGKNCVVVAADTRLGAQALTVSTSFQKLFPCTPRTFIGLGGLATDVMTVSEILREKLDIYRLTEGREMEPRTLAHVTSSLLYQHRFGPYFIEPIVAGLDHASQPFICSTDLIGCINFAKDFVVSGTASNNLFGLCEALYKPDMAPEELFETVAQVLMSGCDRDAYSGWGAVVCVVEPGKVTTRTIRTRMD